MIQAKNDEIYAAIKTGELKKLQTWVESGNRFKGKWFDLTDGNNNALRFAVECEQFETVKWLVEVCKQPVRSYADSNNLTPGKQSDIVIDRYAKQAHYSAVFVALRNNHYAIAKWLIEHSGETSTEHEPVTTFTIRREITLRNGDEDIRKANFEFFNWLFVHVSKSDASEAQRLFEVILGILPFEWCEWIVKESKISIQLQGSHFWKMNIDFENETEYLQLIRWIVEDSGQIIDCRDWANQLEEYTIQRGMMISFYNYEEVHKYLDTVEEVQNAAGIEKWFEGMQGKKKLDDGKQRRRL